MTRKNNFCKNKIDNSKEINSQNDLENDYENEPINVVHKYQPYKKKEKKNCCIYLILTCLLISFFFSLILYLLIYIKINKSIEEIKTQYQFKNINLNLLNNSKQI